MPSDIATAARRRAPDFLIEIDAGDTVRVGTKETMLFQKHFTGAILEIGEIGSAFNFNTFTYSPNTVSVTLANTELFYGKRFSDLEKFLPMEDAECRIFIIFPDIWYDDISTNGLIRRGVFRKENQTTDTSIYRFSVEPYELSAWKTMQAETINTDTWPDHRTAGGDGSVSGNAYPLVFGTHSGGLKMDCIDTSGYRYIVSGGQPMESVDSIADKDGADIASGWTASDILDGRGNLCTVVDFVADRESDEPMTAGGDGVEDTGGNYTGTAAELVDGPGHIFHFLVDHYSSIGFDWADVESIKTVSSLLPSVSLSASCMSEAIAGEWANRILYQCLLAKTERIGGTVGIVSLDLNKAAAIAIDTESQSVGALQISKTSRDLIVNDLVVQYNYSSGSGKYGGEFYRNRTNNALCNESYRLYGAKPKKTLQLPDAGTEMQAGILVNRYLDFFAFGQDIVSGLDLPYSEGWDLRRGDCSEITIPSAPSIDGGGWSGEKCLLLEKYYLKNVIRTTWLKIRD